MFFKVLKNLMADRHLIRSEIAAMGGISRAAVSRWFREGERKGWVNVETTTLRRLADSLKITPDVFLRDRPLLAPLKTRFLWDSLYPNMESFVSALSRGTLPALARLVEILGFWNSQGVAGRRVWNRFPQFKNRIPPVRRQQLELLWPLYSFLSCRRGIPAISFHGRRRAR